MATHSSTLTWEILWTEETGGLWSMGSQIVRHACTGRWHCHGREVKKSRDVTGLDGCSQEFGHVQFETLISHSNGYGKQAVGYVSVEP